MPKNNPEDTQSQQREYTVRAYFEARLGWSVTKPDTDKNKPNIF
jgi:hypothetical protein